jgi:hypothetical protein
MKKASARSYKEQQRELIVRALTDAKFRQMLAVEPAKALGKKGLTAEMKKEVGMILAAVKGIRFQIAAIADELLCANGGGCGIA